MDYCFKGTINSYKNHSLPFSVRDGRLRLDVTSLFDCEVENIDDNGNTILNGETSFEEEYLEGKTDNGKFIKLHISKYYDADEYYLGKEIRYIDGIVASCMVLDNEKFKNNVEIISFYNYEIAKVVGQRVSGCLTAQSLDMLHFKKNLASYVENGEKYYVYNDFLNKQPFCHNQSISIGSDKPLTTEMMEDAYWTARKFFAFIFQIKEPSIVDVCIFSMGDLVGHLFVKKHLQQTTIPDKVKCLSISLWKDKLSNLFQALVDKKIYLRHLPDYENEKSEYTSARFITTIIGFESVLNILGIDAGYSKEHKQAIENVKSKIKELKKTSVNSNEKKEYSSILKNLKYDRLECRFENAFKLNEEYINNFYVFSNLGRSIHDVAAAMAKSRNNFSHGVLEEDLSWEHARYCDFLDLFILYLQLLSIGVSKEVAYVTVPQIMFGI